MANKDSNEKGKNIWSNIDLDQLVAAIASLGDRTGQLKKETWRLNVKTTSGDSLWGEVINKLKQGHNEKIRHFLYNVWHLNRHKIHQLVEEKKKELRGNDDVIAEAENPSVAEGNNSILVPNPSLPLPQRPKTRVNQANDVNEKKEKKLIVSEMSVVFTADEWKNAFSRTRQEMKDDWTKIFNDKLQSSGIECALKFKTPYIKEGKRKRNCRFFGCFAKCTISICERTYQMVLQTEPSENSSILFLVRIFGEVNHNVDIATAARQLQGTERFLVGKRANEIGPLAVFRERIEAADKNLLAAGNFTGCETIETQKKAAADYRKKMQVDDNIYTECRIAEYCYRREDVKSKRVQGYVQVSGEIPFHIHLFSEQQIQRYINYCTKEKYSYVHIDATGGILKKMTEQKQILLYAILFKDGNDCINTIPLAHAILASHTVPSICYFFGNVANGILQIKTRLIRPSFFIIDFSPALMNATLLTFNEENINAHLNRCWNVLCGKYNSKHLQSISFIRFCCCHVIHAVARSLTAARIDKKIRRGVLYIFAFILCGNDIKQLYDILGSVISIFGDPDEQNAKKQFEQLVSFQLDVDEESASMLMNDKKIFKKAKKENDELRIVDEYLRSNAPIIHQSPFNEEAIRLYPNLANLINHKPKSDKSTNPLFSPSIIRIFYRWWAYLPLWTGLLWNFKERYSNDIKINLPVIYTPVRYSNALIESYFRTLKKSIYQGKINNRPLGVIVELYRSVKAQFIANEFGITQSSKGRKRKNKDTVISENWNKKSKNEKGGTMYTKKIDQLLSKCGRSKINGAQSNVVPKQNSESEDITTSSSLNHSISSSNMSNDSIPAKKSSQHNKSYSKSPSSESDSMVSSVYSNNIRVNSGKLTADDDKQSEVSNEFNFNTDTISSIIDTLHRIDIAPIITTDQSSKKPHSQRSSQPEAIIDGYTLRWPKFEIKDSFFEGQSYSLILTCPIDSALFALYFLYLTDININAEFDNAPEASPYSTLVKTFRLVETKGWDAARINWLLTYHLLKPTDQQPKSLFGSGDEQVFCFLKDYQRHSNTITCTNIRCTDRERNYSSTELRFC